MTTLEKIKTTGGFLDCGAVGSMPLGYFLNGDIADTDEYYEVMRLKGKGIVKDTGGKRTNKGFRAYLTLSEMEGNVLKAK